MTNNSPSGPAPAAQASSRAPARAAERPPSSPGPTPSKVRHTVGSDATLPAIAGWLRSAAMSDSAVAPSARANLPFDDIVNNDVWMQLCFTAHDLLVWAQAISLTGPLRRATPKTIRHRLLHVAARTTPQHRRLDLDRTWPWTPTLLDALDRLRAAFTSLTVTQQPRPQAAL